MIKNHLFGKLINLLAGIKRIAYKIIQANEYNLLFGNHCKLSNV